MQAFGTKANVAHRGGMIAEFGVFEDFIQILKENLLERKDKALRGASEWKA